MSETIEQRIFLIRGQKVMLDGDLAGLYGVSVGRLNEAVKRNLQRFPSDFMFRRTVKEFKNLKLLVRTSRLISQFAISKPGRGGRRHAPYAFTEQGVSMLSSVLHSRRAVQVNIVIMRAFVKLREILSVHKDLAHKLNQLENKGEGHDGEIRAIFKAIRDLMRVSEKPKRRIGFHTN